MKRLISSEPSASLRPPRLVKPPKHRTLHATCRTLLAGCISTCLLNASPPAPVPQYPDGENAERAYDFTHPTKPWRRDHGTEGWRRLEQLLAVNHFYYIWWETSNKKVPRFFPQPTRDKEIYRTGINVDDNSIELHGVRGEKVSFQVAVSRRREQHVYVRSVTIMEGLTGPEGTHIVPSNVAINQVGFINHVHPDVLFPMPEYQPEFPAVDFGENGIFWITVDIPRDIPPGLYEGTLRVAIDQITPNLPTRHSLPITLDVSPVVLPKETEVATMNVRLFGGWESMYERSREHFPAFIVENFFPLLARNRMSLDQPAPYNNRYIEDWDWMSDEGVATWEKWARWWDERGLYIGMLPYPPREEEVLRAWDAKYGAMVRKNGWENKTHVLINDDEYGPLFKRLAPGIRVANNRSGEIWGSFVAWYKQDKETARELLDKWTERRDEWIDIYNERPRFTLDTVPAWGEALRNKQSEGKQRAWYWHNQSAVALPALALRDYFWLMYRENVPNTLYWGAVMWCGGSEEFAFGPRRGWNERRVWRIEKGFGANRSTGAGVGNGILFWPGREGVLASMRLEIYRDGVEDFDLMKLLEKRIAQLEKAGGHADLIERARGVLSIPDDRILPSLDIYPVNWPLQNSHYYPDLPHQQAFEQHRRRIVTVLEETRKKLGIDK